MPRVKPLIRPDPREMVVKKKVANIMLEHDLTRKDLSRYTGIEYQRLCRMIKDVGSLTLKEYWLILDAEERLAKEGR